MYLKKKKKKKKEKHNKLKIQQKTDFEYKYFLLYDPFFPISEKIWEAIAAPPWCAAMVGKGVSY